MKKYKVCVYAITKNEEKFVNRWFNSMKEADEIYVLDTGSTDNTVNLLKPLGVNVTVKEIHPWRFDVARNESLELVPKDTDICVCTDLDEVFESGWRKELEKLWEPNARIRYNYNWSFDKYNKPAINFYIEKIHSRDNYEWVHPVHEVLKTSIKEKIITTNNITLNHYPDSTKSRSSYLPLLELSVQEDPNDDRNMHYLGREYMYYKQYQKCIDTLEKHLKLKSATWKDERSASMRFIARSYLNLQKIEEARLWYLNAIKETPYLREPLVEIALLESDEKNYELVKKYCLKALDITNKYKSYINEPWCYDATIYDLLSVAYSNLNNPEMALLFVIKALEKDPQNERILNNKKIIEDQLKQA